MCEQKIDLFINKNQHKKLIAAWETKHFCILRFNKETVYNYNTSVNVECWVYKMIHERIAKNIGISLKFCPNEDKILKSEELEDLMEVFYVY